MKIYEEIIKDSDSLVKFIRNNDVQLNCDDCRKYGFECSVDACVENTIKYLQMDKITETTPENGMSSDEFNKFINDYIRKLVGEINSTDVYTMVNYIRNHMKSLDDKGIVFNDNQKKLLSEEFNSIKHAIDHLMTLNETIDKYIK